MSLELQLILHLRAHVSALGTRIYRAGTLYTNTMPAAVVQRITSAPNLTHQGRSDKRTTELQISIYHSDLLSLDSLVETVEEAMDHFTVGGAGGRARYLNLTERGFDKDTRLFSTVLDYEIIH